MNSIPVCSRASSKFGGASEQVLYLWSDPPNGVSKYIGPGSPAVSMWIVTEPRSCQIPEILSFASNQVDYRRALCPGRHAVGEGTVWKCTVFFGLSCRLQRPWRLWYSRTHAARCLWYFSLIKSRLCRPSSRKRIRTEPGTAHLRPEEARQLTLSVLGPAVLVHGLHDRRDFDGSRPERTEVKEHHRTGAGMP